MKELNEESLDTAIALGDAVCSELGICCEKRGQLIFRIYKKLEELNSQKPASREGTKSPDSQQAGEGNST